MRNYSLLGLFLTGCAAEGLPTEKMEQPLQAECRFDAPADPARLALAFLRGGELTALRGDGSELVLYRFGAVNGVANERVNGVTLVARRGWIAAQAVWSEATPQDYWREQALIDPQGKVVWSAAMKGVGSSMMSLSERGDLATVAGERDGLIVHADGTTRPLPGLLPVSPPAHDGSVLVQWGNPNDLPQVGWVRAGADAPAPLAHPLFQPGEMPIWSDEKLVYLGSVDGDPALVTEGAGEVKAVKVPATGEDRGFLQLRLRGRFALVGRFWDPARVWRIDVTTGGIEEVSLAANGMRRFQYEEGPLLGDEGQVLDALRGDTAGAIYRSGDGGKSWEAVGGDYRKVLAIDAVERGGTYVIQGTNGRYGGETEWPEPAAGQAPRFDGPAVQIVRPASGTSWVREGEGWAPSAISDDGRCVGWFEYDEMFVQTSKLVAYDAERGKRFDLTAAAAPRVTMQGPVWLAP